MKKPNVLFVTERYADGNPQWLSNSHHNLFGSLECSGLATYSNFFFEDHQKRVDESLIQYHRRLSPDLTVITILPAPSFEHNPTQKAFTAMSARGPLVFLWFDSIYRAIMEKAEQMTPYATLNVILDNPFFIPHEKFLALWTPQDVRIYNDPKTPGDIEVSFMGSTHGYPDREQALRYIMSNSGINLFRGGGQREANLSPQEYAKIMQKSKISLSFSKTRTGLQQTKGRVYEAALCGSMLMEDQNQGTALWFEPYKDYVPFTSQEDMVDKINYYLTNPEKREEIASNGKRKAEMHYSPRNWWKTVFDRCGISTEG